MSILKFVSEITEIIILRKKILKFLQGGNVLKEGSSKEVLMKKKSNHSAFYRFLTYLHRN